MRILLVDDSKAMRLIVARTLRKVGFRDPVISEAGSGAEALKAIKSCPPDLILSDWNMPGMTGIELLRELRKAGSNVMFAFVTSEGSAEMRDEALKAGALGIITKPFTEATFRNALDGVVR